MFRRALLSVKPLVSNQNQRGMASVKDIGLNSVKTIQNITRSEAFAAAIKIARVELTPPSPLALRTAIKEFKAPKWQELTVRDAWLTSLVTIEVVCWFFVGECLGKGTVVGYQV